jgi:hypothetical protein
MTHWLYTQLLLTIQEIEKEVTIPRIVVGCILFFIIHTIMKTIDDTEKQLKKHRRHAISHSAGKACIKDDCQLVMSGELLGEHTI